MRAMDDWEKGLPQLIDDVKERQNFHPLHSFFFPIEQYDRELLERLSGLCRATHSEVEIHLHHDHANLSNAEDDLREQLEDGRDALASHGLLSRASNGDAKYAFIHGNWALANCDPSGRGCGIEGELGILRATGCYADFTFPSAPHPTQPTSVNQVGYLSEVGGTCDVSHVLPASAKTSDFVTRPENLLTVHGPIAPNWSRRKWGVFPRLENGDLTAANPPTADRINLWRRVCARVGGSEETVLIKLHTHGGIPRNYKPLLGSEMRNFYRELAQLRDQHDVDIVPVTARQMINAIHRLERQPGTDPTIDGGLDHVYGPPPIFS